MSDLGQFAELMRLATADKVAKEAKEETRRLEEVVPLLSELFAAVQKEKLKPEKSKNNSKAVPKAAAKVVEEKPITELIQKVEDKATDLQGKVITTATEKRFLALFNRLQDDFQALKKHVESKSTSYSGGWGGAGSGEVRILRMDDVTKEAPVDGASMVWDSTLNKFKFVVVGNGGITDEEMPYSKRIDFVGDDIYKGEALAGASENILIWRVRKLIISPDGDVTELWANGSASFDHKWSEHLNYTYS